MMHRVFVLITVLCGDQVMYLHVDYSASELYNRHICSLPGLGSIGGSS